MPADPRLRLINQLNAANQDLVNQLAARGIATEPVTFTDQKFVALVEVLSERADDPDLMLDVMVRFGQKLGPVLTQVLEQVKARGGIVIAGQVPTPPPGR